MSPKYLFTRSAVMWVRSNSSWLGSYGMSDKVRLTLLYHLAREFCSVESIGASKLTVRLTKITLTDTHKRLEALGFRMTCGSRHSNPVRALLNQDCLGPVNYHIGMDVSRRISNLVQQ